MSCSLCRLPFTPDKISIAPKFPPKGILSKEQELYMKRAVGMGMHVFGLVAGLSYLDNNVFAADTRVPMLVHIAWEAENKTFVALHRHCATILRAVMRLSDSSPQTLLELALLDHILGDTLHGAHAGRFPSINYEEVLGVHNRVDIESLWSEGSSAGNCIFDWLKWKASGLEWTAARPDIFPRFRPTVSPSRLAAMGPLPTSTTDPITTQPLDLLHLLLPHLSNKSFLNLLSTCRTLRHHGLTTFQSHARERVLALGWAVPTETEYTGFLARNPPPLRVPPAEPPTVDDAHSISPSSPTSPTSPADSSTAAVSDYDLPRVAMVHAAHSPPDGDWHLYLSQAYRSPALRARRWVWALAEEVARVYAAKKAASGYADVITVDAETGATVRTRSTLWDSHAQMAAQQLMIRDLMLNRGAAVAARGSPP